MNENTVAICGNVASDLRHVTHEGLMITSFRVACSRRRFDRLQQEWIDADTTFVNVTTFRTLAGNVALSLTKGQRVLVLGRLRVQNWKRDDRSGTSVEIVASAIGHDLSFGTSQFTRRAKGETAELAGRTEADRLVAGLEYQAQAERELAEASRQWPMDDDLGHGLPDDLGDRLPDDLGEGLEAELDDDLDQQLARSR